MMEKKKKKLGELLLEYGMINEKQLKDALDYQKRNNKRIGESLINLNIVKQDQINWILSKQFDIPYVQIEENQIDLNIIKNFPEYLIKNYRVIPLIELNDTLVIAMADPTDVEAIERIKNIYKNKIDIVFASFRNITKIINYIEREFPDIWQ